MHNLLSVVNMFYRFLVVDDAEGLHGNRNLALRAMEKSAVELDGDTRRGNRGHPKGEWKPYLKPSITGENLIFVANNLGITIGEQICRCIVIVAAM